MEWEHRIREDSAARPRAAELIDGVGRRITYLRLSITDHCNFACSYCAGGAHHQAKKPMGRAEIRLLIEAMAEIGIRRVRLTGGEPMLRPDLVEIAADVASVPGIEEVALTTNGQRLAELAKPLRAAGVKRLNVSLDTLDSATLLALSGPAAALPRVMAGLEEAAKAGFEGLKVNTVLLGGVNESELGDIARFVWKLGATPRFIELMPFGPGVRVTVAEAKKRIEEQGIHLLPDPARGWGPASYMRGVDGEGGGPGRLIGFIGAMSEGFCATCNRIRVGSDGVLRSCLGGRTGIDLRPWLAAGPSRISGLTEVVRAAVQAKGVRHHMAIGQLGQMSEIGG